MLELIFVTSNNEKLENARHLCSNYNVQISKQKFYGIGYKEPRIFDREKLLRESIADAAERLRKNISNPEDKFFFIEDTSVIILALSTEGEYPGVDIKYWMQKNNFSSIDAMLRKAGNDRRVIVRSDIILRLSTKLQKKTGSIYKKFNSQVSGKMVESEFDFQTNPLYPWLNNKTFNKWFVPDGCTLPLGMLPIDKADQYDFRAGAFNEMLLFLEKEKVITKCSAIKMYGPQKKFEFEPLFFIICGPTCAGKTTLATYLADKYNYYHLEASDFMYLSYYQRHGIGSSVKISDFAEKALAKNPSIVVDKILKNIKELHNTPIIITGFRSPEEIKSFRRQYQGRFRIDVVFIEADKLLRFNRCLKRARHDTQMSLHDFELESRKQENMGLNKIRKGVSSKIIQNNGSIENYFEKFENRYRVQLDRLSYSTGQDSKSAKRKPYRLEDLILLALSKNYEIEIFFTTTEIAHLINEYFTHLDKPKSKNNVSRYFNKDFHPYYEIEFRDGKKRYRLSQTGYKRSIWLLKNVY